MKLAGQYKSREWTEDNFQHTPLDSARFPSHVHSNCSLHWNLMTERICRFTDCKFLKRIELLTDWKSAPQTDRAKLTALDDCKFNSKLKADRKAIAFSSFWTRGEVLHIDWRLEFVCSFANGGLERMFTIWLTWHPMWSGFSLFMSKFNYGA